MICSDQMASKLKMNDLTLNEKYLLVTEGLNVLSLNEVTSLKTF